MYFSRNVDLNIKGGNYMAISFVTGNTYIKNLWELLRDLKVDDKYKNKIYYFSDDKFKNSDENNEKLLAEPFLIDKSIPKSIQSTYYYSASPKFFKYRSIVYHYNNDVLEDGDIFESLKKRHYEPKRADYKKIINDEIYNNIWFFFREYMKTVDDVSNLIRLKINPIPDSRWDQIIQKEDMLTYDELNIDHFLFLIAYERGFKKIILRDNPSNRHFMERFYICLKKTGKKEAKCYFKNPNDQSSFYKNIQQMALLNNSLVLNMVASERNYSNKQEKHSPYDYCIYLDNDCLITLPYMNITGCALVDNPSDYNLKKLFNEEYIKTLNIGYYEDSYTILENIDKRYLNTIYLTCNDINDINHYLHEITYGDTTKTIIIDIASIYRYNTKY